AVSKIDYESSGIKVECTNGKVFEADHVVVTLPLGVLKTDDVQFNPPLPEWKRGAIERLGYGVLNKVVLVYKEPFWDVNRDMVGALREPLGKDGDFEQSSYVSNRGEFLCLSDLVTANLEGRFYFFWNCTKVSGVPMLSPS